MTRWPAATDTVTGRVAERLWPLAKVTMSPWSPWTVSFLTCWSKSTRMESAAEAISVAHHISMASTNRERYVIGLSSEKERDEIEHGTEHDADQNTGRKREVECDVVALD